MYQPVIFIETPNDPLWEQVYTDAAMSGFFSGLKKLFKSTVKVVAPAAAGFIPGVGPQVSEMLQAREAKKKQKKRARKQAAALLREEAALFPEGLGPLTTGFRDSVTVRSRRRQRTRTNLAGFGSVPWQYVAAAAGAGLVLWLVAQRRRR